MTTPAQHQDRWEPPAPGYWESDVSHQSRPYGRLAESLYFPGYAKGFRQGFIELGIPLETIQVASVNGWLFTQPRPLGGGGDAVPPKFVFTLLFALHPEMRRRRAQSERLWRERPWRERWRRWESTERQAEAASIHELAGVDLARLDRTALTTHLARVFALFDRLCTAHFVSAGYSAIPIGDWLAHTDRWAAVPPRDAAPALAGFSSSTSRPLVRLDDIVRAIRAAGAERLLDADDPPADRLARLRAASPEIAALIDEYLLDYGYRPITGLTFFDESLRERPDLLIGTLLARTATEAHAETGARRRADERADDIRTRIPAERRREWDEMLADARHASTQREDDVGLLLEAGGHVRAAGLVAGRLLVQAGRAERPESAFDLTDEELLAAVAGGGPDRDAIASHTRARLHHETLQPPRGLGKPGPPPPVDRFPPAVRRTLEAMFTFVSRFNAEADPLPDTGGLIGHGVSAGVVEGRATVVRSPDDFSRFAPGDVLVAHTTSPSYNLLLAMASAVVTEVGGLISHAAIVAREFGIPGVVGCAGALEHIPQGALIRVDGTTGAIQVIERAAASPAAGYVTADLHPVHAEITEEPVHPTVEGTLAALADAAAPDRFGGKAAGLAQALGHGLTVPPGFALDTPFVAALVKNDAAHLERLHDALERLTFPVAVRSSALDEDSESASFAGQHATVLGAATPAGVVQAIGDIWQSAHAPAAAAYRARLGLRPPRGVAIVVQQLIDADVAGVAFTRHPATGADEIVVEAAWGLGETVVSGVVTPDHFRLTPDGHVLERRIGRKDVAARAVNGELARRVDVPPDLRETPSLTDAELREIAALARSAERCLDRASDVEWALCDGMLYCLQVRPITTGARLAARAGA